MLDETCAKPTLLSYECVWDWKTHRIVDQMQVKAQAQAQAQHAQSGPGHARTKDTTHTLSEQTRKQVQGTRRQ